MQTKDLIVTGDAKVLGTLATKDGKVITGAFLNRTNAVNEANANYTTLMARGTSLHSADTNPSVNGAICWTYK